MVPSTIFWTLFLVAPLFYLFSAGIRLFFVVFSVGAEAEFDGDTFPESDFSAEADIDPELDIEPTFDFSSPDLNIEADGGDLDFGPEPFSEPSLDSHDDLELAPSVDPSLDSGLTGPVLPSFDNMPINYFSLRLWTIVISSFGGGGLIGTHVFHWALLPNIICGIVLAAIIGFILFQLMVYLYSSSIYNLRNTHLKGKKALVTIAIPSTGLGQVRIGINNEYQFYKAKSKSGRPIPSMALVEVVEEILQQRLVIVKRLRKKILYS